VGDWLVELADRAHRVRRVAGRAVPSGRGDGEVLDEAHELLAVERAFAGRGEERGERSVGLMVDSASDTGAFRLYERAGMAPVLGLVMYEKELNRGS
jgi:hypothetical protein